MNDYHRIERAIRYLDTHYTDQPPLGALAQAAGLSESHFHRLFSRWAGVTPKTFLQALTAEHAKALLRDSRSVLDTSLEVGLSGPGRLHDLLVTVEGMTPGQFKEQGRDLSIRYGFHPTPFGTCLIGITDRGICQLTFADSPATTTALRELKTNWKHARLLKDQTSTGKVIHQIFSRKENGARPKIPVLMVGTPFQLKVWKALLRIPAGRVLSYQDVARLSGHAKASRAVGTALSKNPVCYLIPCHRVIRESGVIGQYRWGRQRKQAMLAWEQSS